MPPCDTSGAHPNWCHDKMYGRSEQQLFLLLQTHTATSLRLHLFKKQSPENITTKDWPPQLSCSYFRTRRTRLGQRVKGLFLAIFSHLSQKYQPPNFQRATESYEYQPPQMDSTTSNYNNIHMRNDAVCLRSSSLTNWCICALVCNGETLL